MLVQILTGTITMQFTRTHTHNNNYAVEVMYYGERNVFKIYFIRRVKRVSKYQLI